MPRIGLNHPPGRNHAGLLHSVGPIPAVATLDRKEVCPRPGSRRAGRPPGPSGAWAAACSAPHAKQHIRADDAHARTGSLCCQRGAVIVGQGTHKLPLDISPQVLCKQGATRSKLHERLPVNDVRKLEIGQFFSAYRHFSLLICAVAARCTITSGLLHHSADDNRYRLRYNGHYPDRYRSAAVHVDACTKEA
jgi:hypothetical protein